MSVKIHFLNTGSGDCTIIHFPERVRKSDKKEKSERIMMVDLNHHENDDEDYNEYENVIEYYKNNFVDEKGNVKPIFRFVCSHPHHDHFCGLNKLFSDKGIDVVNFWDLDHGFEPDSFDGHPWHSDDWEKYKKIRKGGEGNPTIIKTHRGDQPRLYWNDEEDRISILSPSLEMIKKAHYKEDGTKRDAKDVDIDSISYALTIQINSKKIILAGDSKDDVWQDIFDNCKSLLKDCDILKAGHHGQESAFHKEAGTLMNPGYVIFSNSEEEDKNNGAEKLYKGALPNSQIYKTHEKGTIVATIPFEEDEKITFEFSK